MPVNLRNEDDFASDSRPKPSLKPFMCNIADLVKLRQLNKKQLEVFSFFKAIGLMEKPTMLRARCIAGRPIKGKVVSDLEKHF